MVNEIERIEYGSIIITPHVDQSLDQPLSFPYIDKRDKWLV